MLIKDIGDTWTSAPSESVPTRWQCREGVVLLSLKNTSEHDRGFLLNKGDALDFPADVTVYYRRVYPITTIINTETLE